MKYVPKEDHHVNFNISHEHPAREFLKLVLALAGIGLGLFILGSLIVEFTADRIPVSWEKRFLQRNVPPGDAFHPVTTYLQKIINQLKLQETEDHYDYSVKLICSEQPNAMAVPGGRIYVTSGLEKAVKSENGLAFVLAHEIGHFHNRDHLKSIMRGLFLSVLGSSGNFGQTFGSVLNLSFSRDQESKADNYGLHLLDKTYGDIDGAGEFFEAILKQFPIQESIPTFLRTHPGSQERLARIRALGTKNIPSLPLPPLPSWKDECSPF